MKAIKTALFEKLSIKKNDWKYILCALFYYVLLNFAYVNYHAALYWYVDYNFTFVLWKFLLGGAVYLTVVLLLTPLKNRSSSTALYMIFYLSIAPFMIIYQYQIMPNWMLAYTVFTCVLLLLFLQALTALNPLKKFRPKPKAVKTWDTKKLFNKRTEIAQDKTGIVRFTFGIVLFFFAFLVALYGLPRFGSLGLADISEVRKDANFSLVIDLGITVVCKILIPILLVVFLQAKSWWKFGAVTLVQLYVYSITGFKTYLFILAVIVGLYIVRKLSIRRAIFLGLIAAVGAALVMSILLDNNLGLALVTHRVVFFPAKIKWAYLDFFSNNPLALFSESTLAQIFNIPPVYDGSIPKIIGGLYFDEADMWANTGYMVDAYANLGVLGGVIITAILAIELYIMDVVTCDMDKGVATIFTTFFIALNDGGLISISVSGGFLAAILFFGIFTWRQAKECK